MSSSPTPPLLWGGGGDVEFCPRYNLFRQILDMVNKYHTKSAKNKWLINFVALLRVQDFKIQKNDNNFHKKLSYIWYFIFHITCLYTNSESSLPKTLNSCIQSCFSWNQVPMFSKSHHDPYIQFIFMERKTNQHRVVWREFESIGPTLLKNPLYYLPSSG